MGNFARLSISGLTIWGCGSLSISFLYLVLGIGIKKVILSSTGVVIGG
jgi:hypothetical protein